MKARSTHYFQNLFCRLLVSGMLTLFCASIAEAQPILNEGFEGSAFPPAGWSAVTSNASYPWARVINNTGSPGPSAHGGSYMARYNSFSAGSGYTAELRTPALNFTSTNQVVVSFWMYRDAGYTGYTNEKIEVFANTSATSTGGTLIGSVIRWSGGTPVVTANGWYQYFFYVPVSFNTATNYIIFKATSQVGNDMYIDDVNIYNLPPCSGPVSAGTILPSGTQTVCPGAVIGLQTTGYGLASAITQQWQYSLNGGASWNSIPGANSVSYTTFPISAATRFRFFTVCNNTGDTSWATPVIFNVTGGGAFPQYAGLPFSESFESWTSGCSTTDIPSVNWTNNPSSGNTSWRRDDQGASASWTTPTGGAFTPNARVGSYAARFHSYYSQTGKGELTCYIDCSAQLGNKELEFYSRIDPGTSSPNDSLNVHYSTDGGINWLLIGRFGPGTGVWDFHGGLIIPSNSATTLVRFTGSRGLNTTGFTDIYLDAVRILPPCAARPVAGKIDSVEACAGRNFQLSLTGTSSAAGLTYNWQYKATGSTAGWSSLPGGNVPNPKANISVPTSFRVIVSCSNTTPALSDTSAVYDVKLSAFYYCYCDVPVTINFPNNKYNGIANVNITTRPAGVSLMSNSSGINYPYISYARTVAAPKLIRDSTYRFSMTDVTGTSGSVSPCYASFYLDYNRNGVWDLPNERIMAKSTTSTGQTVIQDFTIPSNANTGLTGLRAIHAYVLTPPLDPCGTYYYNGETEDYLVYIEYQPCNGPVTPGTAHISDTSVCPGYTVDLWDTGYEKQRTGIIRTWEVSTTNGAAYSAIPGSTNKDTMLNVTVPASSYALKYRLRVVCANTGDTTYSNSLSVTNPPASSCYPFASVIPPGTNDSSDIGSFLIGPYVNPQPMVVSGPHLTNPAATCRHTDYTHVPNMILAADSTYRIAIYHTMRSANHADALVSVYIDFNHDGKYSEATPGSPYPSELIYRGTTRFNHFFLDDSVKMPSNLIAGVPTGLRVILNNDLNPSGSGNTGSGGFISGEVEDYVVTLTRTNLGVGGSGLFHNVSLFPNPTANKATVAFDVAKPVAHLDIVVTTLTGQVVMTQGYDNVGKTFRAQIDLSGKAKGVYLVRLEAEGIRSLHKLIMQ